MSKYYTPSIEEFHVGFECEWQSAVRKETWNKQTCDVDLINIAYDEFEHADVEEPFENQFRVKHLDKEDIESLGFRQTGNMSDGQEAEYQLHSEDSEDFWMITRNFDDSYEISYEASTGKNLSTCFTLFDGKIKNKSELIKLLQQLGIRIKDNKE